MRLLFFIDSLATTSDAPPSVSPPGMSPTSDLGGLPDVEFSPPSLGRLLQRLDWKS